MWIPILLTLFAFTSVFADIEEELNECKKLVTIDEDNLPEDMDAVCPIILGVFDCVETAFNKETGLTLDQLRDLMEGEEGSELFTVGLNVRDVVKDLCDKDSQLHKEYSEHAECYKTINTDGENDVCVREAEEAINLYEQIENKVQEEADEDTNVDNRECMTTAYVVACTAAQVKAKCGQSAFDTFRTIIKRTTFFKYGICSEDQMDKLKTFVLDHMEIEGDDKELLHLALDLKKRRK